MKRKILILLILSISVNAAATGLDILYRELDNAIAGQRRLSVEKEKRLSKIKEAFLRKNLADRERYELNAQLYHEYSAFQFDSAYRYISENVSIAIKLRDRKMRDESLMSRAQIISVLGEFIEAFQIYRSINPKWLDREDLIEYYNGLLGMYEYKCIYGKGSPYFRRDEVLAKRYREILMEYAEKGSHYWKYARAAELAGQGRVRESVDIIKTMLHDSALGERRYSIVTAKLAYYYGMLHDIGNQKRYLIISAISDIKGSIKENSSLRELAMVLLKEGDSERAYRYLIVSIDDARYYNTRLRNIQSIELVPAMVNSFQQDERKMKGTFMKILGITGFLSIMLVICAISLRSRKRQSRMIIDKKSRLKKELDKAIAELQSKNRIKRGLTEMNKTRNDYLVQFLKLGTSLIARIDLYETKLIKLVRKGDLTELYYQVKSSEIDETMVSGIFECFDMAFLRLYPNFIESINSLMVATNRYGIKANSKLNTELRILALLRLGINSTDEIATILHSQVSTINTYRSRIKGKLCNSDNLEGQIMRIE